MPLDFPRRAPGQFLHRREVDLLGQLLVDDPALTHPTHLVRRQRLVGIAAAHLNLARSPKDR